MKTAESLERIKEAEFQLLATAVLSLVSSDYAALIETGSNARGRTIKSPLDAFCLVPGSDPPHFVLVEHTITEPKPKNGRKTTRKTKITGQVTRKTIGKDGNLETKWIGKDGDLKKAGSEAEELRKQHPDARCTVVLATSQRPAASLLKKVYAQAATLRVSVDIWEQSRFARFLDTRPEGQWLRSHYLGIKAEKLSAPLLRELCKKSLADYEKFIGTSGALVGRKEDAQMREPLQPGARLRLLVGGSGFGKSTCLLCFARENQTAGELSLWIPARCLSESLPLEVTIEHRLRDLYPTLAEGEGARLGEFLSQQKPLSIIVDDPNRETNSWQIVQHLISWVRPLPGRAPAHKGRATEENSTVKPYVVFCPLWPSLWASLSLSDSSWCQAIFIGSFTLNEAMQALTSRVSEAGLSLSSEEIAALAALLSHDPYLIKLFGELLEVKMAHPATQNVEFAALSELAGDVIGHYIDQKCREAAQLSSASRPAPDFRMALAHFGAWLLEYRNFAPIWEEVKSWFQGVGDIEGIRCLQELSRYNTLWRLGDEGSLIESRPAFRHDRLRQYFLVEAMERRFKRLQAFPPVSYSLQKDWELIGEPFFAEVVGEVVYHLAIHDPKSEIWDYLRQKNPLALVAAYCNFKNRRSRALNANEEVSLEILRAQLILWAEEAQSQPGLITLVEAMAQIFQDVDDHDLLLILKPLGENKDIGSVLLRNGEISSGWLGFANEHWDRIQPDYIPALLRARSYHRESLVQQLTVWLTKDLSDESSANHWFGAIATSAFLGFGELMKPLCQAWEMVPNAQQSGLISIFIWSALHCFQAGFEQQEREFLMVLMDAWEKLSDESRPEKGHTSERSEVGHMLSHLIYNLWPESAIQFLIDQAEKRPGLVHSIEIAVSHVDAPDVYEFSVRRVDRGEEYSFGLIDHWGDRLGDRYQHLISQRSLERLRKLWQDETLSPKLRCSAFQLWCTNPDGDDASLLEQIKVSSPFYIAAMKTRAKRGDMKIVPEFVSLLDMNSDCWQQAHFVWGQQVKESAKALVESISQHSVDYSDDMSIQTYYLCSLLTKIPLVDAEEFLVENWEKLGKITRFLHVAFWLGTPQCLLLAQNAIHHFPMEVDLFYHLDLTLPFWPREGEEEASRSQMLRFLQNILPYWGRLDARFIFNSPAEAAESQLAEDEKSRVAQDVVDALAFRERNCLIEACLRVGAAKWGKENLYPLLADAQCKKFFPSDIDLLDSLDEMFEREKRFDITRHIGGAVWSFFHQGERRGDTVERLLSIVLQWLKQVPHFKRFTCAVTAVEMNGQRSHLREVESIFETADLDEDNKIQIAFRIQRARIVVQRRSLD